MVVMSSNASIRAARRCGRAASWPPRPGDAWVPYPRRGSRRRGCPPLPNRRARRGTRRRPCCPWRRGEELELAVAGAPAHGRDVHVARGQGIVGHLVEERRRGVCSLKAGVFGEIGERLVHDGDDVGSVVGSASGCSGAASPVVGAAEFWLPVVSGEGDSATVPSVPVSGSSAKGARMASTASAE